jgi:hypothetical protein
MSAFSDWSQPRSLRARCLPSLPIRARRSGSLRRPSMASANACVVAPAYTAASPAVRPSP